MLEQMLVTAVDTAWDAHSVRGFKPQLSSSSFPALEVARDDVGN